METPLHSDEQELQLLLRLRDGDRNAFTLLYHHYAPVLAAKLIKLFRDEAPAQDVLQDTFIRVWEHRNQLDVGKNFGGFLFTIAANLSNNVFRKQLRETTHRMQAAHERNAGYMHVEEAVALKEKQQILEKALSKLPPKQREVFVLHRLKGKSYREISEILGIKESTINNHIQQATKRLRILIGTGFGSTAIFLIFL